MIASTDVDIDVADRNLALSFLPHVNAMICSGGTTKKHNTGVYFQDMPYDPFSEIALIDHKQAGDVGYFKFDILNNHVYENIKDEEHLVSLLTKEPMWELLEHEEVVEQLFHLSRYAHLTKKYKPNSIMQLAMLLAIIRPAKAHLQDMTWEEIEKDVWTKVDDGYAFKKSHAVSYAAVIVVQLNRMVEELTTISD